MNTAANCFDLNFAKLSGWIGYYSQGALQTSLRNRIVKRMSGKHIEGSLTSEGFKGEEVVELTLSFQESQCERAR